LSSTIDVGRLSSMLGDCDHRRSSLGGRRWVIVVCDRRRRWAIVVGDRRQSDRR
jgi:hypothetical protein